MTMATMKIYAYYGLLGHEKEAVYSPNLVKEDCVIDELTVEMPPYPTWKTVIGETGITLGGTDYLLREVLADRDGKPAICWYDGHYHHHKTLTVVEHKPATWSNDD